MPHQEHPDIFNQLAVAFLERQRQASGTPLLWDEQRALLCL